MKHPKKRKGMGKGSKAPRRHPSRSRSDSAEIRKREGEMGSGDWS